MIKDFKADIKVRCANGLRSDSIIRTGDAGPAAAIEAALIELTWAAKAAGLNPAEVVTDAWNRLAK